MSTHEAAGRQVVGEALRRYAAEAGRMGHAVAGHAGVHPTDMAALVAVLDAQTAGQPLTAGGLAAALDLSTGAVTAVLDRLEAMGHLHRQRDPDDRRRVLLFFDDASHSAATAAFEPLAARLDEALAPFSEEDLRLAAQVLDAATAAVRAEAAAAASAPVASRPGRRSGGPPRR